MAWDEEFLRFIGVPQEQPPDPMAPERADVVTPQPPVEPDPEAAPVADEGLPDATLTSDRILEEAVAGRGPELIEPIGVEQTVGDPAAPGQAASGLGIVEDPRPWPPPEWLQPEDVAAEPEPPQSPFGFDPQGFQLQEPAAEPGQEPSRIGEDPSLGGAQLEYPERFDEFELEMRRQARMSPEEQILDRTRREQEQIEQFRQAQLELIERQQQANQEAWEDFQESSRVAQQRTQQIAQQAQELAQENVDPGRWWSDRTTGGKVASFLTAAIGGVLAPHRGGQNTGMDFIERQIQQDIDAQAANLDHRRAMLGQQQGIVAEMYRLTGDEHRARLAATAASHELAAQQLEAELQGYDPMGTAVARGLEQIGQMYAQRDEALREYEKAERDFEIEARKDLRAQQKHDLEMRQARRAAMGGGGAAEPEGDPRAILDPNTGEELPLNHPRVVIDPVPGDIRRRGYVARSEEDAKQLQEKLAAYRAARDEMNQYRELARTAETQWREWGGRLQTQAQTDLSIIGRRAAAALGNFERRADASANYVEMIQEEIPGIETKGSRTTTIKAVDRLIESLDRDARRGFYGAGVEPPKNLGEMGEVPAGYEPGIREDLEPREHKILRDTIRGAGADVDEGDLSALAAPPADKDPETVLDTLDANLGTISETLESVRSERDRAQSEGDHERAKALEGKARRFREVLEQARDNRQRAHIDVRREQVPEEIRESQRRTNAPPWAMP